jgi:uncharacterized protein YndB with AHSA1/START domain
MSTTTNDTTRDFTMTWMLDAAPAEVFRAWTDPEELQWFYNDHQPIPDTPIEVDLRIGGAWRLQMVIDEDTEYFTGGIYREIVLDEKLAFAWGATDGWPKVDPDRLDESPLVTVSLRDTEGRTEMTVHVELPAHLSDEQAAEWMALGINNGWRDTVDRLAAGMAHAATS